MWEKRTVPISREDVVCVYRELLGRDPESDEIINWHMSNNDDVFSLIRRGVGSVEFQSRFGVAPKKRKERMLNGIDLKSMIGVEIGPACFPIVTRAEAEILYVDHLPTSELIKKYRDDPRVDLNSFCEIDFVWGEQTLRQCLNRTVDYIIASHVAEHVPDLAGWLVECQEALRDGGILSLALPDQRYTFDHLRALSTPATLIDAYLQKRRSPSPGQVFDHYSNFCEVEPRSAWCGRYPPHDTLNTYEHIHNSFQIAQNSFSNYVDAHCWVFTCDSFLQLLDTTFILGLNNLEVVSYTPTEIGEAEFFIALQKLPSNLPNDECRRLQRESLLSRRSS